MHHLYELLADSTTERIISLDLEGDLSYHGRIDLLQLSVDKNTYVFDLTLSPGNAALDAVHAQSMRMRSCVCNCIWSAPASALTCIRI